MRYKFDVLIVGGGLVGSLFAVALAERTSLSVAIIESQSTMATWTPAQHSPRVSAISLSTQRIFSYFNLWNEIREKRVSPFEKIQVWDAQHKANIEFNCFEIGEVLLGHIIENNLIQTVLHKKIEQHSSINLFAPITLTSLQETEDGIELVDANGNIFFGKLAVAADGSSSWLREQIGINVHKVNYDENAIVTEVQTTLPHQRVAKQVFGEWGPLAFLPLNEKNTCSIVWSLPSEIAKEKMAMSEASFKMSLANYFSYQLGEIKSIKERYYFPLIKQLSKQYVKGRVVLMGDAAHTIHPLAGQGVNMGMLDAVALCEIIENALQAGEDFTNPLYLRRYQRWRKADNFMMSNGIDIIKKLFKAKSLGSVRNFGVTMTNHVPIFKNFFTSYAVGNRNDLPIAAQ